MSAVSNPPLEPANTHTQSETVHVIGPATQNRQSEIKPADWRFNADESGAPTDECEESLVSVSLCEHAGTQSGTSPCGSYRRQGKATSLLSYL